MTEKPRETQAESHVVELKEKVNNSSLMKHRDLTYAKNGIDAAVRFYDGAIRAAGTSDAERSEIAARLISRKDV